MAKKDENLILGAGRLRQVGLGVSSQSRNESPGQVMVQRGGTAGHRPLTKIKPWCASQAFSPLQSPT